MDAHSRTGTLLVVERGGRQLAESGLEQVSDDEMEERVWY